MNKTKKLLLYLLLIGGSLILQRFLIWYMPQFKELISIAIFAFVAIVLIVGIINWEKKGNH